MSESIELSYAVIDQIVADINRLAERAQKHARLHTTWTKNRGGTADKVQESYRLVAQYANTLSTVMRATATSINAAKEEMQATDITIAQQYAESADK